MRRHPDRVDDLDGGVLAGWQRFEEVAHQLVGIMDALGAWSVLLPAKAAGDRDEGLPHVAQLVDRSVSWRLCSSSSQSDLTLSTMTSGGACSARNWSAVLPTTPEWSWYWKSSSLQSRMVA